MSINADGHPVKFKVDTAPDISIVFCESWNKMGKAKLRMTGESIRCVQKEYEKESLIA